MIAPRFWSGAIRDAEDRKPRGRGRKLSKRDDGHHLFLQEVGLSEGLFVSTAFVSCRGAAPAICKVAVSPEDVDGEERKAKSALRRRSPSRVATSGDARLRARFPCFAVRGGSAHRPVRAPTTNRSQGLAPRSSAGRLDVSRHRTPICALDLHRHGFLPVSTSRSLSIDWQGIRPAGSQARQSSGSGSRRRRS